MGIMKTHRIKDGIDVRLIDSKKFKTNLISFYMNIPLCRESVTKVALLSQVLKRGTEKYRTLTEISKRLEELYGAILTTGIRKKGDSEVLFFSIEFVSDKFLSQSITSDVIEMLNQIVLHPFSPGGAFDRDFVKQEKDNLKSYILSVINDKKEYAQVKCTEKMFKDVPYGIFEYGYVEDLKDIDEKNLYGFYNNIISNSRIDIFVNGTFEEELIISEIDKLFSHGLVPRSADYIKSEIAKSSGTLEPKLYIEEMDVSQSKLCMGLSCDVKPNSEEYYSLMLFNCILGGSPFSKLFNNVREKLSLAYYVFARLDKNKSYMQISSGIETDKYNAAYDEIMVQLSDMKTGNIKDSEIEAGKKFLSTSLYSLKDSLRTMEDYYYSQMLFGEILDIETILDGVSKVSKSQLCDVGKKIELNTVYFLKGKGVMQ